MRLTEHQVTVLRKLKEDGVTEATDIPDVRVSTVVELIQMDPPMAYIIDGAIFVTTHGFSYLKGLDVQ